MATHQDSLRSALPWLLGGAALTYLVGWTPNFVIAAWMVPLLLLRGSRRSPTWTPIAVIFPLLTAFGLLTIRGAWHMGLGAELGFSAVMAVPLTVSLLVDRILYRRLSPVLGTLVFPSVWVLFDYAYSFIYGLGDVFSPALTQFHFTPLLQLVSLTGIYGITFLIGWTATVAVTVWDNPDDVSTYKRPVAALLLTLVAAMFFGSGRLSSLDHDTPTVRVASVVVPYERDYYDLIIDRGAPRVEADRYRGELQGLEDELFAQSERAVSAGAKIVFWSESAAPMYEDHEAGFLARGAHFAKEHGVYLQTASLVMRYDDTMIDNQVTLFQPDGEVGYTYLKTQTWYPTESDGVIHAIDTPFGVLSSVICFDLDTPAWMRQVARLEVDILLAPSFDTRPISPYHTEAGLFRAVELGVNIVRGVNKGTSMAVDTTGRTLALQDFFRTEERIMYVDMPTAGNTTLYGMLGDWVPLVCFLTLMGLIWAGRVSPSRRMPLLE